MSNPPIVKDPTDRSYWFKNKFTGEWEPDRSAESGCATAPPTRASGRRLEYERQLAEAERQDTRHRRLREGFNLLLSASR